MKLTNHRLMEIVCEMRNTGKISGKAFVKLRDTLSSQKLELEHLKKDALFHYVEGSFHPNQKIHKDFYKGFAEAINKVM